MIPEREVAINAANRAVVQADLAYQFSPGSYTYWAYVECLRVRDALEGSRWIEEFLDERRTD